MPAADLDALPRINLSMLTNVPGATKKRVRASRGRGSKKGKKNGRGDKGTGQHGNLPFWFQGGQTPIWRLLPKRHKPKGPRYQYMPLNLDTVKEAIDAGKLDPNYPINLKHLWEANVVKGSWKKIAVDHWGVKLLSRGAAKFDVPVTIEVQKASQKAIAAVEAAGGTIACKYYNKLGLRAHMLPHKFDYIPRVPLPIPRVRKWYENPANRGVLTKVESPAEATAIGEQQ